MKIIAYIICVFKSLPKIIEIEMENLTHHLKRFSSVEKTALEQRQIYNLIRTLDQSNEEVRRALINATEGDNKEVVFALVQYIHKNIK